MFPICIILFCEISENLMKQMGSRSKEDFTTNLKKVNVYYITK
jgi:hypothetical protein